MAKELFKEGSTVVVSLEDKGFRGSWYTATVLCPHNKKTKKTNNNHLYLEFHTLTSDNKATKRLGEFFDVVLVHTVPPRESYRTFRSDEEVDAFHNDGWWEGIITSVVVLSYRFDSVMMLIRIGRLITDLFNWRFLEALGSIWRSPLDSFGSGSSPVDGGGMGQHWRFAIGGGGSLAIGVVRVHALKESLVAPFQVRQCEVVERP